MTEPQYFWQVVELRGIPLLDMPEEEFHKRLEELIQQLEAVEQGGSIPM